MSRPLRTLLFSTLYPSAARPGHGIFVETRLRELLRSGDVQTKVIAPVPWFFSSQPRFGDHALFAQTPQREVRGGVDVRHPRYLLVPKIGMTLAPLSLALGAAPAVRRLIDEGFDFDVIDAHYYYPDGVAAGLLARWFGKPFTVTARGSDLNLIANYRLPRRMMGWAADRAAASIGVSQALVDVLSGWGVPTDKLHVVRNGVDLERFHPMAQSLARQQLGLVGGPLLLSVGNLVGIKGHDLTIDALAAILPSHPDARLFLIGAGSEQRKLEARVQHLGLESRVRFVGTVPNAELACWYSAADVSVLSSSREGWANVLLESIACGTPVVATRRGGTPEVITIPAAGRLVDERDAPHIAEQIVALLRDYPDRALVRRHAEGFGWQATSRAQLALLRKVAGAAHWGVEHA